MHVFGKARLAPLGCLLAAGLVLAACGGSSSHSASANPAAPTTTTVAGGRGGFALTAFRTCMSSHGVTLPTRVRTGSPNGGPPGSTPGETRPSGASGARGGGFGFGGGNLADRFSTPPKGVDPTKYAAALAACKSTLPTGGTALNNSAFQAYRSCLSDHGVTLPATGGAGSINRNDPKVQAAMKTCQALLPAGGFRRATTTTTTVAHA
jgi:hypothetical protein